MIFAHFVKRKVLEGIEQGQADRHQQISLSETALLLGKLFSLAPY